MSSAFYSITVSEEKTLRYFTAGACHAALGLQKGRIKDNQISVSSEYNAHWGAKYGRLRKGPRCWLSKHNNHYQWFKVDFKRPTKIIKVATQGRRDANQWVTRYQLEYSQDNVHWALYRYLSQDKVDIERLILFNNRCQTHYKISELAYCLPLLFKRPFPKHCTDV